MHSLERRVEELETREPVASMGKLFLWAPSLQTYDEAKAAAGLADYEGEVTAIRLVGIKPPERAGVVMG